MAMSMITCQDCGARHHYRSKCSCQGQSGSGGGSGLGKVGFILRWVALSLAFAVVISLVIWWAGEEFGRLRGTIAAAGIMLLLNLFVLGMLTESWLDGEGDWDPFNHMLGNIMGGLAKTYQDLTAIRTMHQMDRPWMKAAVVGCFLGIAGGMATIGTAKWTPATLLNAPMPAVTLPMVGGGEFTTADLEGRTTVVVVRANRGQSAGRIGEAWAAAVEPDGFPDYLLIVMDQYGETEPYREGRWMKVRGPIAVGRKWLRESFGDFEGQALLLVVDADLVVRHLRTVPDRPPVSEERARAIVEDVIEEARRVEGVSD